MGSQHFDSRTRALPRTGRVFAPFHDSSDHPLAIARNSIAVHIASKDDKPEFRDSSCALLGMVVETGAAVNDQNSRTLLVPRVVRNQHTGQFRFAVAVGD